MQRDVAMVALAVLTACDATEFVTPDQFDPTVVLLRVTPSSVIMSLADTQVLGVWKVMSTGALGPVHATWVSSNPDVVTVTANGVATAVGVGRATVSATAEGLSAVSEMFVTRPAVISDALVVEGFTMIEYQYPPDADHWSYAPQFKLRATGGRAVTLLGFDFLIPGIGDWRFTCGAVISAADGVVFNGEFYGDWKFSLGGGRDRAGSDSVRLDLTILDEKNEVVTHTVFGQIFPGGLPTANERLGGGECFRRYWP